LSTYLLDSDVLFDVLKGIERAVRLLRSLRAQGHELAVMTVVIAEVFAGTPPELRDDIELFLGGFRSLPLSDQGARRAGEMRYDFDRLGRPLATTDLLIAATALEHGATLVTRNVRDYPIAELNVLTPY
jgi:predicted nucleic acid-binding protein